MSYISQNIFFGITIDQEKYLTDEQSEMITNDSNTTSFYNGNMPTGGDDIYIGIEVCTLEYNKILNLDSFYEDLDREKMTEKYKKIVNKFKTSKIFDDECFKSFDLDNFIDSFPKPSLIIIPESN